MLRWFVPLRTPVGNGIARFIEFVDGPKFVQWALLAFCLGLWILRRRLMGLIGMILVIGSWLPGHFVKKMFHRERPPNSLDPIIVYHDVMSYPSGHTGFATALGAFALFMLTMWGLRRAWHVVVVVLLVLVVALSRLYASAHFPLDVLGGALLAGGTSLLLFHPLAAWWRQAQRTNGFFTEPGSSARSSPVRGSEERQDPRQQEQHAE